MLAVVVPGQGADQVVVQGPPTVQRSAVRYLFLGDVVQEVSDGNLQPPAERCDAIRHDRIQFASFQRLFLGRGTLFVG